MNTESFDIKTRVVAGDLGAEGAIIEVNGIEYNGAIIHLCRDKLRCKFSC